MLKRVITLRRVGVAFIVVWTIVPIYWALNISLQNDGQAAAKPSNYIPPTPTLKNYKALLIGSGETPSLIRRAVVNTFIECGVATLVTVVVATLAAYAFARMRFRGRSILFAMVLTTLALPAYTTLIPIYRIMSDAHLVNTYFGIIVVYVAGFLPLAVWILHNYMVSLPISLEEAAEVDGANRMRVLWHIVMPLARPGIISTALITFLFAWAQFLFPFILSSDITTEPLTVAVASLQGRHTVPITLLSASGIVSIAVPAVIAVLLNRHIVSGLLAGSMK